MMRAESRAIDLRAGLRRTRECRGWSAAVCVALALSLTWLTASAQDRRGAPPISAAASLEPSTATVGDRLRLTLRIERDRDAEVELPDVPVEVAPLDVLSGAVLGPRTEGDRVIEEHIYVLAAFETGELGIPQLPFTYVSAYGDSGIVWTDSLSITIVSVIPDTLAEEDSGPRDIKPPVDLPRRVWPFVVAAAVIAGALVAFHYLRMWWRARSTPAREKRESPPRVPRRSAHVIAFERLRTLEADDPIGRGEMVAFYVAVTEIVRLYLRDRFAIDAVDMTTSELAPAMSSASMDEREIDWTVRFLGHADLAKFAKHRPTPERAREDFRGAWEFVERTRFREEAEKAGGGPGDANGGPENANGGPDDANGGPENANGGPEYANGAPEEEGR